MEFKIPEMKYFFFKDNKLYVILDWRADVQ